MFSLSFVLCCVFSLLFFVSPPIFRYYGDMSSQAATKALAPAPARSFLVRFSTQAPNFTISFKYTDGNVLHRRILRKYGEEAVVFENPDIHPAAKKSYASLPHLVAALMPVMHWTPVNGSQFWYIFHETNDKGYGIDQDFSASSAAEAQPEAQEKVWLLLVLSFCVVFSAFSCRLPSSLTT